MKNAFALAALAALLFSLSAAATTQSQNVHATPEQRCEFLAQYASDVAYSRDLGVRIKDVKEINAEKYRNVILDAHNQVAEMTYRHSDLSPEQMQAGILSGCMETVKEHRSAQK